MCAVVGSVILLFSNHYVIYKSIQVITYSELPKLSNVVASCKVVVTLERNHIKKFGLKTIIPLE